MRAIELRAANSLGTAAAAWYGLPPVSRRRSAEQGHAPAVRRVVGARARAPKADHGESAVADRREVDHAAARQADPVPVRAAVVGGPELGSERPPVVQV